MDTSAEPSSSISFTSPSRLSNGSTTSNKMYASGGSEAGLNLEIISLSKLSCNLGQLLSESGGDFSDAEIVVEETSVGVHRCILAARSKFFNDLLDKDKVLGGKEGKPRYYMTNLLPYGKVGYEAFVIFLSYLYTGKLRPSPLEVSTCVDSLCAHDACRPAIDFAVELMYASTIFQVSELVSLFQRRLVNLVGKAIVEDVIPILTVAFHCQLSQLLTVCIHRVAQSDLETIFIEKILPSSVAEDIRLLRLNFQAEQENQAPPVDPMLEKHIKRIHKALDSDDIELVRLLLTESDITLDEACALHYSVAFCDPKIVSEVLSLGLADVNLRNSRGYTVLHVAARRKEPSIIVSLLTKGASAAEPTCDGQSAVSICRRLVRPKEYQMKREKGQEANKDRICIDVLEREMRRNPTAADASFLSLAMADDLHMKLLYLEDRVAFARMFFPTEAKLAMEIAYAETTSDLAGLLSSRVSSGNLMEVDLNETPISQKKRLISKIETLSRTVELGRRYFPHCSQVLDKFMEDDLPDALYLETGTPEEQKMKRTRFMELRDEVHRAFNKDKAKLHRSGFSSSSSSFKDCITYEVYKI
ncbi:BTB/POZ domain and ankyrin repeat-containing protein NPR1 [Salvia miltiorrhiza]|uniref:BTB/POZ domain and ankyrin repeat-containing protein NPR1 n=1 Tax=Salvia miltiorrhiza TaxID=226208 RepID=UPI0025ACB9E4|nr:BTB/POZ domain and ankyrin repeat-containing protein NPR1 [Salvia miltiorrhiza]XP_057812097.1 BTB/POZ domain and ankyrin repeat-containing protein NPR1 [Salvia miltiorrhiza]XP_057812099.1 BTB/POZ domain and ankyrin repeat-containing protein NPR1 [Salvia miltiorrhiza]